MCNVTQENLRKRRMFQKRETDLLLQKCQMTWRDMGKMHEPGFSHFNPKKDSAF